MISRIDAPRVCLPLSLPTDLPSVPTTVCAPLEAPLPTTKVVADLPPAEVGDIPKLTVLARAIEDGPPPPAQLVMAEPAALPAITIEPVSCANVFSSISELLRQSHAPAVRECLAAALPAVCLTPVPPGQPLPPAVIAQIREMSAGARSVKSEIEIPGPAVVAIEQSLAGMDVESMVLVVMSQLSAEDEQDLRAMMTEMQKGEAKRAQLRSAITALKEAQQAIGNEPEVAPGSPDPSGDTQVAGLTNEDPASGDVDTTQPDDSVSGDADTTQPIDPAIATLAAQLHMTPEAVQHMDAVREALAGLFPVPALSVFLTDSTWLEKLVGVHVAGLQSRFHTSLPSSVLPFAGANGFATRLLAAIRGELLDPDALRKHAEDAYKDVLADGYFVAAQKDQDANKAIIQGAQGDAQARFDTLAQAGASMFGSDFQRRLAHDKCALFEQYAGPQTTKIGGSMEEEMLECMSEPTYRGPQDLPEKIQKYFAPLEDNERVLRFIATAVKAGMSKRDIERFTHISRGERDGLNSYLDTTRRELQNERDEADQADDDPGTGAPPMGDTSSGSQGSSGSQETGAGASAAGVAASSPTAADLQDELDAQNDLKDNASVRLQLYMDRYSKIATALSNLLKKIDDTANVIVGNIK